MEFIMNTGYAVRQSEQGTYMPNEGAWQEQS
jgi:hypothetical protein